MLQADPNSGRSQRRANRTFTGSRPARRAKRRLASATGNYQFYGGKMPESGFILHKPGSMKPW